MILIPTVILLNNNYIRHIKYIYGKVVSILKRKIVVGVWKDKLLPSQSLEQATALSEIFKDKDLCFDACVAPSPVSLIGVQNIVKQIGAIKAIAQDVHWPDSKRSFIGSTSIAMLKEIGIDMCMIGHSERRRIFNETNEDINKKLLACIDSDIYPILAIGDDVIDYDERKKILIDQLTGALCPNEESTVDVTKIAIAYEPVWAISTWRSAQALPNGKEVDEVMNLVADILVDTCKFNIDSTPLLYGGSVAPSNAEEYFSQKIVDGALVGGASLKVDSLATVFNIAQNIWK